MPDNLARIARLKVSGCRSFVSPIMAAPFCQLGHIIASSNAIQYWSDTIRRSQKAYRIIPKEHARRWNAS
jgi:hypothetical protein